MAQEFLTLEGPDGETYYYDPQLGGFFKKVGRAFSSAAKAVTKVAKVATKVAKPLTKVVSKTVRYGGAGVIGTFMPAGARKKAFGLTESESKKFETGAKVTRGVVGALGAAALVAYGGPAAATMVGKGFGKAGSMLGKMGKDIGGVLIKNKDGIFKMVQDKAGELITSKFDTAGAPQEMQNLPDDEPIPFEGDVSMEQNCEVAPFVAGSGSLEPGGDNPTPRRLGDSRPYDYSAVIQQRTAVDEASINPGDFRDDEDVTDRLTPFQEAIARAEAFDTKGFRELMAEARIAKAAGATAQVDLEGDVSLQGILSFGWLKKAGKSVSKAVKKTAKKLKPSAKVKTAFTKVGRPLLQTGTSMLMSKMTGGASGGASGGAASMMQSMMKSGGKGGSIFGGGGGGGGMPEAATDMAVKFFNPQDIPDSLMGIVKRGRRRGVV